MKIPLILVSLLFFAFCSTPPGKNSDNDTMYHALAKFKDYNTVVSFFKRNDSLFCNTTNGTLCYNRAQDQWLIDVKDTINSLSRRTNDLRDPVPNIKIPIGYGGSSYTDIVKQHSSWLLIAHGNEGAMCYKEEIVDTIRKIVYRFPCDGLCDFMVEDSIIWIGSNLGISKIDRKSLSRINYYMLPAFKKIKAVIETRTSLFYLDFHYGLFKYDKSTKQIEPVNKINNFAIEYDLKFMNALMLNNCLYIIGSPMDPGGSYLKGNACLIIYNIDQNETQKIDSHIGYFDSFLHTNDLLICFGQWFESYEGGSMAYSGGAIAYNLKNTKLTELTNIPVTSLYLKDKGIEALSIRDDFDCYLGYEKFQLSIKQDTGVKSHVVQEGAFYACYDSTKNEGDTIIIDYPMIGHKKVLASRKRYNEIAKLYRSLNEQRTTVSDSVLKNLLCKPAMIKIEAKKIEMDNY